MRKAVFWVMSIGLWSASAMAMEQNQVVGKLPEQYLKRQNQYVSGPQEQSMETAKKQSPEFYELEQKIGELQKEIERVLAQYRAKEISREEAREQIKPLLEKQIEIRQSKEYQFEQMAAALLAEPAVSPKSSGITIK